MGFVARFTAPLKELICNTLQLFFPIPGAVL